MPITLSRWGHNNRMTAEMYFTATYYIILIYKLTSGIRRQDLAPVAEASIQDQQIKLPSNLLFDASVCLYIIKIPFTLDNQFL